MKKCPFCTKKTPDEAIKCVHCGEMLSEKARARHLTGFWEDLGQRAKKALDKFEANTDNREKKLQEDEEKWQKDKKLSCLGCLLFVILVIVGVICVIMF